MRIRVTSATSPKEYNENQKSIGSTLKTLKGSSVKRSTKYGVGKEIGGKIYAHKDYLYEIVPKEVADNAIACLQRDYPQFQYNCFRYDPTSRDILFQESPDFNTAREPVVGYCVLVSPNGITKRTRFFNQIWHHKWLWVDNSYSGFDVGQSWEWSKEWLSTLTEPADGSNTDNWKAQLYKFGLK